MPQAGNIVATYAFQRGVMWITV